MWKHFWSEYSITTRLYWSWVKERYFGQWLGLIIRRFVADAKRKHCEWAKNSKIYWGEWKALDLKRFYAEANSETQLRSAEWEGANGEPNKENEIGISDKRTLDGGC